MKRRFSYTFAASTLVEMLIVIIVSGILFIALFDGWISLGVTRTV